MPDFKAPTVQGTAADSAVSYVLHRVISDCNFRHYMLGTETLELCVIAEAERRGMSKSRCERELMQRIKAADKAHGKTMPEPLRLQRELERCRDA